MPGGVPATGDATNPGNCTAGWNGFPITSLTMMPGTYFCRASAMFSDWVRWIWFTSTILTLAGTLSTSMPELELEPDPDTGVVGYTRRGGKARRARRGFWASPRLGAGSVRETTRGGRS